MITAQINNVPAEHLKSILLVLSWIVTGAFAIWGTMKSKRVKVDDQPVDVSVAGPVTVTKDERFVTKAICQTLHAAADRRISKVENDLGVLTIEFRQARESSEASARSRSAGIYGKIDEVRLELAGQVDELRKEITTQLKDTERALGRIEGKLDRNS